MAEEKDPEPTSCHGHIKITTMYRKKNYQQKRLEPNQKRSSTTKDMKTESQEDRKERQSDNIVKTYPHSGQSTNGRIITTAKAFPKKQGIV